MENPDSKPVRRVRYKGTHPKAFKEKYKELQPELYGDDVEKVKMQGRTPAGMHRSICIQEILNFLDIQPGQIGLDCTLGYGGHSLELLKRLTPNGHLYAIDVDPFELPLTKDRLEKLGYGTEVLTIQKLNFSDIDQLVFTSGLFHFVLADLGVSSMQIDNPERGFSFKTEGPLDLRLNPNSGISAATLLKKITLERLIAIFNENADEPNAGPIAEFIKSKMAQGTDIKTTKQMQEIIKEALACLSSMENAEELKKTCQRCFQALRIEVNDEFGVLDKLLEKLPKVLESGGKVAILSFHSGEDRRVKKSFQKFFRDGIYANIAQDIIRPTAKECDENPRAKSAKLRWAVMA